MLVLSRSRGQRIVIDGKIVLTVDSLAGHRVRIGIEAPPGIGVARHEVCTPPAPPIKTSLGVSHEPLAP